MTYTAAKVLLGISPYDMIFQSISQSNLFRHIFTEAYGDNYIPGSAQFSYIGMSELNGMAAYFSAAPAGLAIDIGCGEGSLTQHLRKLSGREIIGFDTSSKAIQIAEDRNIEGCRFGVAHFCALPLRPNSVAVVIALDCVQHADDPMVLARELARVSKAGAHLLITHWMPLYLEPLQLERHDPLCAALCAWGFTILEVIDLDPGLTQQFRVYAYVYANRDLVIRELGASLFDSLMLEARHFHIRKGAIGHLGILVRADS